MTKIKAEYFDGNGNLYWLEKEVYIDSENRVHAFPETVGMGATWTGKWERI